MGVANTKSTEVTKREAFKVADAIYGGAVDRVKFPTIEVAAADDAGSVYRMCRVHSSWNVNSLRVYCDSITTGTDYDLGLYDIAETNSGAVVDADLFASAVDLSTAIKTGTEIRFESASVDIADSQKRVWELLVDAGIITDTVDPNKEYDLCFTGNTPGSAAGTISLLVNYNDGT